MHKEVLVQPVPDEMIATIRERMEGREIDAFKPTPQPSWLDVGLLLQELDFAKGRLSEASTREEKMRGTLLWLNMLGGLGHEKHERINAALGVEYPKFCKHPDKCAGKGRCMADWVCND